MKQQFWNRLPTKDTTVVITSALYVGTLGQTLQGIDPFRLQRLQQTITAIQAFQFAKIIVIDATVPDNFLGVSYFKTGVDFVKVNSTLIKHENEYQVYGPSRLEIDLMVNASLALSGLLANSKYVLKLSAGYSVSNLKTILTKASNGVVYRFGNPLRRKVRFCLSSFYLLPTPQFLEFITYAGRQVAVVSKKYPLEAVLYDFMQTLQTKVIAIDYPIIKATFLSSQTNSDSRSFRTKLKVYQLLSKLGLYAQCIKFNHPIDISPNE